jgi:hypothetical protein
MWLKQKDFFLHQQPISIKHLLRRTLQQYNIIQLSPVAKSKP